MPSLSIKVANVLVEYIMFNYRLVLCCRMNGIATSSEFSYDFLMRSRKSGADLTRLLLQENYNFKWKLPCI